MRTKLFILTMHFIFPLLFCISSSAQELAPSQDEPSIIELHQAAIRYNEVSPSKITNWRRQAALKALLPDISVGYDTNVYKTISTSTKDGRTYFWEGPDDQAKGWDISASWDLGDLIYNDDQTSIDSRSKLMVQLRNDVLEKLNQAYFERKRLKAELLKYPDKESSLFLERQLKIEELTAQIDALTGGYFSRKIRE